MSRPALWVLAGPNGAGKSTLYRTWIKKETNAEFINADLLAHAHFGHPAETEEESRWGQQAAEDRRQQLLQSQTSMVVESTFSHESKLELVTTARKAGYNVFVLHLSVDDVELLIARVKFRTRAGGHDVPEERIRRRFVRNLPLIREAVLQAHRGWVFDTAELNTVPAPFVTVTNGVGSINRHPLPPWIAELYGPDLKL